MRQAFESVTAMPSVHVSWALLTTWVVVVTGNHYGLAGAAVVILVEIVLWTFGRRRPRKHTVPVDAAVREPEFV
jgi:hypothetical protein